MKKIYLILVFCLILILLMPVAFASDDNSTLDNSIENLNDKTTYENMKTVDEKFRDPIDDDFTDVNSTFYELKYNLLEPKSSTIQSDDQLNIIEMNLNFMLLFLIQIILR